MTPHYTSVMDTVSKVGPASMTESTDGRRIGEVRGGGSIDLIHLNSESTQKSTVTV